MNGFEEVEYEQLKLDFIKVKLKKASFGESDWSRRYYTGKWAIRYLGMLEKRNVPENQIDEFCNEYWENSSVRRYYIELCMKGKDYGKALEALHDSIVKDKGYAGLVSEYSRKKRDIYLL